MGDIFDLSQELSIDKDKKKGVAPKAAVTQTQTGGATLFFLNSECQESVLEAYRFEGLEAPKCIKGAPVGNKEQELGDVVIVEMGDSADLEADAEEINVKLPNNKAVILLGQTDSIHTLRRLEKMGFYYLPSPIDKHEFIECLKQVGLEDKKRYQSGYFRKAKSVAIIGAKGGIGTSVLSVELCSLLGHKGSRTILMPIS